MGCGGWGGEGGGGTILLPGFGGMGCVWCGLLVLGLMGEMVDVLGGMWQIVVSTKRKLLPGGSIRLCGVDSDLVVCSL